MHFRLIEHGEVDSTSERAFASLEEGKARHGDVHLALGQSRGRGRMGRDWFSPPGEGLYMSLVLRPEPPPYKSAAITMATGLAIVDAITALGVKGAHLEWPNDVVVDGAKIGGILVESRGLDSQSPHYVIGIGINVRQRGFPPELLAERAVTSLARLEMDVLPRTVLQAVLAHLPARLAQLRSHHRELAEQFLEATRLSGRRVSVQTGDETWLGSVRGLTLSEGLELELEGSGLRQLPLEFIRKLEAVEG